MPAHLTLRLARAAAFAVVCLGLGVLAHLSGGGVVSAPAAACALALAFLVALPATGGERGLGVIWPLLTGTQVALHLLFSTVHLIAPLAEVGGHAHSGSGLVPGLGMVVAHGWAGALAALWLARGEAALWAVLRRLAVRLFRLLKVRCSQTAAPARLSRTTSLAPPLLRSALLRYALSGRAPPLPIRG
ncbi:MFS transporter [Streptosporangium sp. NPDC049248]|uniref:MFS transporter n=1 Tax=Streptosporangium sp. NPDC049248 TaxID=3155651 RepID=UPI0034477824